MKKIIAVLLLALVAGGAFAEIGFGLTALYKSPLQLGEFPERGDIHAENFTLGAAGRLKISLFQGEATALVGFNPLVADIFLDAGLALDIAILRLSAGVGPNLSYGINERLVRAGYNFKLNADVVLGSISVGITYIFTSTFGYNFNVQGRSGLFGVSLLFY